jgi:soluble lytic murein transglycosylase-like protein
LRAVWAALGWLSPRKGWAISLGLPVWGLLAWALPPASAPLLPEAAPTLECTAVDAPPSPVEEVLNAQAPQLPPELRHLLAEALSREAEVAGLDPLLVVAIMSVESGFELQAASEMGAMGLMQVQPQTLAFMAEKEGIKLPPQEILRDPLLSARLGVRYLAHLHRAYRGDLDLALMAYNTGPSRLNAALEQGDLEPLRGYPRVVRRVWGQLRSPHRPPATALATLPHGATAAR